MLRAGLTDQVFNQTRVFPEEEESLLQSCLGSASSSSPFLSRTFASSLFLPFFVLLLPSFANKFHYIESSSNEDGTGGGGYGCQGCFARTKGPPRLETERVRPMREREGGEKRILKKKTSPSPEIASCLPSSSGCRGKEV